MVSAQVGRGRRVPGRFWPVTLPWRARAWLTATGLAGLVLPIVLVRLGHRSGAGSELLVGAVLVAASIVNVEIGRLLEGGVVDSQRPHKALSAWSFAAALLLPTWWLLPVVAVTYAHAWWRGLRPPLWKWVGSALYLVLCGFAAAVVAVAITDRNVDLMAGDAGRGLLAVLASAATFLAVETLLFHGSAYLNHADDEVWLRKTLRSRSFYLTESAVLLIGGLSAAMWSGGAWMLILLIPVYALTQRAVLHEPLRDRADHDDKTGALRFESWRHLATLTADRCWRRQQPWAVLFVDIDHFKLYNDAWGHLAGDEALVAVVEAVERAIGTAGLVGRFGGEEFCAFLSDTDAEAAAARAEAVRAGVADLVLAPDRRLTVSVGLAAVSPDQYVDLEAVLNDADHALFDAKNAGRNTVAVRAAIRAVG